jgi:hypothetical protein
MLGYVTIDTPEQFKTWMDDEVKKAKESSAGGDVWG